MHSVIFLITILLSNIFNSCSDCNQIKFEVINQRTVENKTHNYLYNKEIEFRITNNSEDPIYLKSIETDEIFPIGFFIRFDKKWEIPFENNTIPKFKELEVEDFQNLKVEPKESFTFTDLLPDSDARIKFKRVVYISINEPNSVPLNIESPEFSIVHLE